MQIHALSTSLNVSLINYPKYCIDIYLNCNIYIFPGLPCRVRLSSGGSRQTVKVSLKLSSKLLFVVVGHKDTHELDHGHPKSQNSKQLPIE